MPVGSQITIAQSDSIKYKITGFDAQKYFELQKSKIIERIQKFHNSRLYLEIGGKFLFDAHASRVLPGFDPRVKEKIFTDLQNIAEVIFCVNFHDIVSNRQLSNTEKKYADTALQLVNEIYLKIGIRPKIVVNLCPRKKNSILKKFKEKASALKFEVFCRFLITGYPHATKILSQMGFGADEPIPLKKNLILVTGAASSSGKMSTCLGQIFLDFKKGIECGYAKFETFPIWNLPLMHPVNLAYEAATADIGDFNSIDQRHKKATGVEAVNYNRDIEAFEIVMKIARKILPPHNFMHSYRSPTEMGINSAGLAITNDEIVSRASLQEIKRRKNWYAEITTRSKCSIAVVKKCVHLEKQAHQYLTEKGYLF